MKETIFISGTPCVGKTTASEVLSEKLNCRLIKINELAIENDFVLGIDKEKGYKIIDIDRLNTKINEIIADYNELLVFEGHLAHLCDGADKLIILRLHPDILKERLSSRNYSPAKIRENLEAEAIGICTSEAYELYGQKVNEIDVSNLDIGDIIPLLENIIFNEKSYPVGEVDFMDWLISNP